MQTGMKLSGESVNLTVALTLSRADVTAGPTAGEYQYNVTELLFYTQYNFSLVADYNLTGAVAQSSTQSLSHETQQGGELDKEW
jgi:hypothetical protein